MKQTIDDAVYRSFLNVFQMFSEPARLAESELCDSCLVTNLNDKRPDLLPHQALKQVFSETLNVLEKEQAESADLLRGRFWEGLQIEEMVAMDRPRPMGKRSFSNHQRNAIHAFAFLFQQRETNCVEQPIATEPVIIKPHNKPVIIANDNEKKEMARPDRKLAYLLWIVPLILIGLVSVMLIRWLNRPPTWTTDGMGLVETVDDRVRGDVTRLQGVTDENPDLFDQFDWSGIEDQFNVAWMQKGSDYSAVYVHVDTSNGFREFKFVPEDDAPEFTTGERYQVGMGIVGRDGEWHLNEYDLQAIAADLEPMITLNQVTAFHIKTRGEILVDKVEFSPIRTPSLAPTQLLQDGVAYSETITADAWHFYKIEVPNNASKLTVIVEEMTADIDLYVRRNVRPSGDDEVGVHDCHSSANGLQRDICVMNQVQGSIWYIGVHGDDFGIDQEVATYTLLANYEQPPPESAWETPGNGTISRENDPDRGEITHLQGVGNDNEFDQFRLLSAAGATAFNVSWELKAEDYVAVYVEVDTVSEEVRTFKFSPDDKPAVFEDGNRYKVGTPDANRNGEWHTYTYDLQAVADQLETGVVFREVTAFYIGTSGEAWIKDVSFGEN